MDTLRSNYKSSTISLNKQKHIPQWTFNPNPHPFTGNLTHFSAKSGSQNTDSRESLPPTFLKITPRICPDYTIIGVRIPPFPKSYTPTYGEALPIPLATIAAHTLPRSLYESLLSRVPSSI